MGSQQGNYDNYQPPPPPGWQQPPPQPPKDTNIGIVIAIVVVVVVVVVIVLATVLYAMVIGFSGGSGTSTPAGSWSSVEAQSDTSARLTFGVFSQDVAPSDIEIILIADGMTVGTFYLIGDTYSSETEMSSYGTIIDAYYFDYNPYGNTINAGDYIMLNDLNPGTYYQVVIFHTPTDCTISMTGDYGGFTTPG